MWAAIGLRVSHYLNSGELDNANANVTFEGNQFTAVVKTDNVGYEAYAVSLAYLSAGVGQKFVNNTLIGNHRLLNFGDSDSSPGGITPAKIVDGAVFDGNIYQRATAATHTGASDRTADNLADGAKFNAVYVGGADVPVKNIQLIDQRFAASVPAGRRKPLLVGAGEKVNVSIYWRVVVTVKDLGGVFVPGATVRVIDRNGQLASPVGTTGADGKAQLDVLSATFSQPTSGVAATTTFGPYNVRANSGSRQRDLALAAFDDAADNHGLSLTLTLPAS